MRGYDLARPIFLKLQLALFTTMFWCYYSKRHIQVLVISKCVQSGCTRAKISLKHSNFGEGLLNSSTKPKWPQTTCSPLPPWPRPMWMNIGQLTLSTTYGGRSYRLMQYPYSFLLVLFLLYMYSTLPGHPVHRPRRAWTSLVNPRCFVWHVTSAVVDRFVRSFGPLDL